MKARLLTTLAALLLVLSAWANGVEIGGINYSLDSNKKTASVTNGVFYKGNITIPASVTYDGTVYSVASIEAFAFWNCTGLTSISIPSSVTAIRDNAFSGCTGLTSISIPASVTTIGNRAFHYCI